MVALSFLVFALLVRTPLARRDHPRRDLLATPAGRVIAHPAVVLALRLAAFVLFVATVLAGLLGDQNPYRNLAPTLVWIVWWVGLAFLSAFAGDLWALLNPWRSAFDAGQWLAARLGRHRIDRGAPYPARLGVWPATALLLAFAWIELIDPEAASPAHVACLALAYSALTWGGMLLFGRDAWLQHGEVFSLFFGTLARFAPTEARDGRLLLRPYGAGLIESSPVPPSMVAFVLLMLATVLYDGLLGTGEWALLEGALAAGLPGLDAGVVRTAGLAGLWLAFLGAYVGICAVMSRVAGGKPAPAELAGRFALTLVPIAIGYHVAHYLVFLLVQGQYIVPLMSDPFGRGWDLFGTAGYRVDITLVGARTAWYAALAAIVGGHVIAVYLAHRRAIEVFGPPRLALATQAPLTALMVIYTFIGLSITAEPIVESRAGGAPAAITTAAVAVPPDAVLPDADGGALVPVGPGREAELRLAYKILGSAFHDGTRTSAADLLYAYAFAYRWGTRSGSDDAAYDPHVEAATALLRRHLAGVRLGGVDAASKSFRVGDVDFVREIFTVEVYLAAPPSDPAWSALLAPPWSTLPWTLLALMEEAVVRGWAAFSAEEAARRGVPWLDLVRSPELAGKLAALVEQFAREAFRPPALEGLVGAEEARRRWSALAAFYRERGHFLVANGPYRLRAWAGDSVTLEAFRDLTYPLGVGSYDAYAVPRRGFVGAVEWNGGRLRLSGDMEVVEKFQRSHRLVRMPLASVPAVLRSRAAPECRYVVIAADGRIAAAGSVPLAADASFEIGLGDRLPPGRYTVSLLIAVNWNVVGAELKRIEIVVPQGS